MKNLKSLKLELLSSFENASILSREEKKTINGGQYTSEAECKEECGGWQTAYGPSGSGICHESFPGNWDCYDS